MEIHVIEGTIESWRINTSTNAKTGIEDKSNKITIIEDSGRTTIVENLRAHRCFDRIYPGDRVTFIITSSWALWGKELMCAKINGVEFLHPQLVHHQWRKAYLIYIALFIVGIPMTFFLVGIPMIIMAIVLSITTYFSIGIFKETREAAKNYGFSLQSNMQENIRKI